MELVSVREKLKEFPSEENLWNAVVAMQGYPLKTAKGLDFTYRLKVGKSGSYTKELLIDRRENSKSLTWSSVMLAYRNLDACGIGQLVQRPKALGDIRGVSYIYSIFYALELLDVPEKFKSQMSHEVH